MLLNTYNCRVIFSVFSHSHTKR